MKIHPCRAAGGLLIIALIALTASEARSTDTPPPIPAVSLDGTRLHRIQSAGGREFLLKIQLPEGYERDQRTYPVLYLLDGDHAFALATDVVRYLGYGKHVPPLIIASPAYGSLLLPEEGGSNRRGHDLNFVSSRADPEPGGEAYLRFLAEDLIPYVESHFRADRADRTLWGYSLGGSFAANALFRVPGLFHRYVIIDGFQARVLELELAYHEKRHDLPAKVFLAAAVPDGALSRFHEILKSRSYRGLSVDYVELSDLNHFAIPAEGLARGLKAVFGEASAFELLLPIARQKGGDAGVAAYHDLKQQHPGKDWFNAADAGRLLRTLANSKRFEAAIALGELATREIPGSAEVHEALADVYRQADNKPLAAEHYRQALDLKPDNPRARDFLERMLKN